MEIIHEEELKAHLMETDENFRQLSERHSEYDKILVELESKPHLSDEEQIEETRLKKLKLHAKDQMLQILSRHKTH
jgi:uncharacterized protein YdcH (DUF465 family)